MNKKRVFVILAAVALVLGACFSPWKGDEGTLSIHIGGPAAGGLAGRAADGAAFDLADTDILRLEHTITLSGGPGPEQTQKNIKYGDTVNFSAAPGRWTITITAFLGDELYAEGSRLVDIKPGPNGAISIQMTKMGGTDPIIPKTLTGITVTAHPYKTQYNLGEDLDTAGMEVTAAYSDGSTQAVTGYTIGSEYDKTITGNQAITVTWQGMTTTFTVNVIDPTLPTVAEPTASPAGGNFVAAGTEITLHSATDGAEIWYTINGATPAKNGAGSALYTGPFAITPPVTVKAAAFKDGMNDSAMLEAVYPATPITVADITIIAPVKGEVPAAAVRNETERFTAGTVTWSPGDSPFKGGVVYTATVTLTANSGYTFTGLHDNKVQVNGEPVTVSQNTGGTVMLSHTFPETGNKTVSSIAIKTPPYRLTYDHGDELDLSGLVITLTYDDHTTEDIAAADFTAHRITTTPAHDNPLEHSEYNGKPVEISYGRLTITTGNLTVNAISAAALTIDPIEAHAYTGSAIEPAVTVKHTVKGSARTLTLGTDYTVAYSSNTGVGTAAVTITGKGDYTGAKTVNFTINKADPTVTAWPTAASITYGAQLSASALSGGRSAPDGTFAWTNGAITPTVSNSGYSVTFTPADTDNYNTVSDTVSITVNKAEPVITAWPTAADIIYGAKLSASVLSGGESTPAGTFTWTNGAITPTVANSGYSVTFTPDDTVNYNAAVKPDVAITVARNTTITITLWLNEQDGKIQYDGMPETGPIIISQTQTLYLDWKYIDETPPEKIPRWYIGGSPIGTGSSIEISAKNYNSGTYQLMVMVYKNGNPYSAEISFEVVKK